MFSPSRFVVVDDEPKHLAAIVSALGSLGTACLAIQFDSTTPLDRSNFVGVRCLFLDLELVSNARTSTRKSHFATAQTILEDNISEYGGPFVLVLWTNQADQAVELEEYLHKNLDPAKPYCAPLAVLPLAKADHISIDTGEPRELGSLVKAITERIQSTPSLATFLEWEVEVLGAAGEVLSDIVGIAQLVLGSTLDERGVSLANVMKRLATEAVGESNLPSDPRGALHAALLPMLSDYIQNPSGSTRSPVWTSAFDQAQNPLPGLDPDTAAHVNTRIHLDFGGCKGFDWGAVSTIPKNFDWPSAGLKNAEDLVAEMKLDTFIAPADLAGATPIRIRVGAACDYAQRSRGPVPMVFGLVIPTKADGLPRAPKKGLSQHWISPTFQDSTGIFQVMLHPRLTFVSSETRLSKVDVLFRLREQVLLEVIDRISSYESRPGIVSFKARASS